MAVKVMVVENHPMIRHHLRDRLQVARDLEIVGEATGSPALELIGLIEPDVVILDMHTSPETALGMTREIRNRFPAVRVVGFGERDDTEARHGAAMAGAWAYVPAIWSAEDLAHVVRSVARASRQGFLDLTVASQRASPR
jgi:DNA-binding NarL/FixJ family response regulator